jgi:hypothetical protein
MSAIWINQRRRTPNRIQAPETISQITMHSLARLALAALAAIAGAAQASTTLIVDPSATYLRTSEDYINGTPHSAFAYSLASLGLSAGDTILLQRLGAYQAKAGGTDTSVGLSAVFSSSATIYGPVNPSAAFTGTIVYTPTIRIPDALMTTLPDYVSKPSYYGNSYADPLMTLSTDIAQDFNISTAGVTLTIPTTAQFIFFSANDNMFGDNTDPDHNFGLLITAVPEPATYAMLGAGLLAIGAAARRKRS